MDFSKILTDSSLRGIGNIAVAEMSPEHLYRSAFIFYALSLENYFKTNKESPQRNPDPLRGTEINYFD
jgi:hypothetical protein